MDLIDWRELETQVGLEHLPSFHRAFLAAHGVPDPASMPLRRVQQAVERELNRLVQEGHARREGETLLVDRSELEGISTPGGMDFSAGLDAARQR
jgi:hypothetical protein